MCRCRQYRAYFAALLSRLSRDAQCVAKSRILADPKRWSSANTDLCKLSFSNLVNMCRPGIDMTIPVIDTLAIHFDGSLFDHAKCFRGAANQTRFFEQMCDPETAILAGNDDFLDLVRHRAFLESGDKFGLCTLSSALVVEAGNNFLRQFEFHVSWIASIVNRFFESLDFT
jgi:hypothetical protein